MQLGSTKGRLRHNFSSFFLSKNGHAVGQNPNAAGARNSADGDPYFATFDLQCQWLSIKMHKQV